MMHTNDSHISKKGPEAIDLYMSHPQVPCLHVHARPFENSCQLEGVTDVDCLVVQNEAHAHSEWAQGFHINKNHLSILPSNNGSVFFIQRNCTVVLPELHGIDVANARPLRFKFVVTGSDTVVRFVLPKDTEWSNASYTMQEVNIYNEVHARALQSVTNSSISVNQGVVTIRTCSMREVPAYVIQPCM